MVSSEVNSRDWELNDDEGSLVERLRRGDEQAYEYVVRHYGPRLLAVAKRFLQHDQDAQDAVQEALLSAFKAIDSFQANARLSTWLHRIVVNAALMRLRSRRSDQRSIDNLLPQFTDDGQLRVDPQAWAMTYDTAIRDRELREVVRRGIDELPDSYRAVLLLRDIEERSTQETADLLDISPAAVKTRLHRARLALRTLLDPYMRGERS